MNRAPTRTTQLKFTSFIPGNEASFPSSVSWSSDNSTYMMVLLASMAAARACQCRRLLHRKLTEAEGYPQAISYDQSFGLLKACYNSYFHICLLRGSELITATNWNRSIGSGWPRWSSKLPPLRPPGLDSLIANRVAVEVKFFDGRVDTQSICQDLEEM